MTRNIHRVVNTVYEAAIDQSVWQKVADCMVAATPGTAFALHRHVFGEQIEVELISAGFKAGYIDLYKDHFVNVNPMLNEVKKLNENRIFLSEEVIGREFFEGTEFYRDWCRPQNDLISSINYIFEKNDKSVLAVSHLIPRSIGNNQVSRLYNAFKCTAPHIGRAIGISNMLSQSRVDLTILEHTIDHLEVSVFVVDEEGAVAFANRAARAMLDSGAALNIDKSGTLCASQRESDDRLKQLVGSAFANALPTPAVRIENPGGPFPLMAMGLRYDRENEWQTGFDRVFSDAAKHVCLFVFDASARPQPVEGIMCHAFDLTKAQCQLAVALSSGETLKMYADRVGISRNTARNHLAAIMEKLGISRQSELVSMVTQLSAVVSVPE